MTQSRLYTWSFTAWHRHTASDVLPVRTSMGKPRFIDPQRAAAMPVVEELIPYGLLKIDQEPEFARRYRARLEKTGVDAIEARFRALIDTYRRPLALLCFEKLIAPGEFCHRRIFAAWWEEQTGEPVPEYESAWEPIRPPEPEPQAHLF